MVEQADWINLRKIHFWNFFNFLSSRLDAKLITELNERLPIEQNCEFTTFFFLKFFWPSVWFMKYIILDSGNGCKSNVKSVCKIYLSTKMSLIYHYKNALNIVESCVTQF